MNQGRNKRTGRRVPRLLQHICPTSTNETDPSCPWNNPRQRELVSKQLSFIPLWDWYRRFENSTPPVIPDYARMRWYVRAPTSQELLAFVERVKKCLAWDFLASAHSFTSSFIHLFQSRCVSDILQDVITNRTFILRFTPKPSPRFVFPFLPFLYRALLNDKQHASLPTSLARDMACRAMKMIPLLLQTL